MDLLRIPKLAATSLVRRLPLSLQIRFGVMTSADIDRAVDYAVQLSNGYLERLATRGVSLNAARILEIGPGLDFAPQLVLVSWGAKVTVADPFLSTWDRAYHPDFYRRFKARWSGTSGAIDEVIAVGGYPDELIRCIREPAESLESIPANSCDVVLSTSVLEHVSNLRSVCQTLARVTVPGGIGIHSIDFMDHWSPDRPLDFLLLGENSPEARRLSRGNRLRLSDHLNQFRQCGFDIELVEPYAPPDKAYFDSFLPKLRASSSPYRDASVEDLSVLGALVRVARGG